MLKQWDYEISLSQIQTQGSKALCTSHKVIPKMLGTGNGLFVSPKRLILEDSLQGLYLKSEQRKRKGEKIFQDEWRGYLDSLYIFLLIDDR